jgi:indole-3-glycerol phosphate synthase
MILDDIVAATKERVKRDLENDTLLKLEARLPDDKARPFAAALKHPSRLGLIAEIKKASPSKGVLAPDFDLQRQAELYRDGGTDCLSVLTEPEFFQGDLEHLRAARQISGKPVYPQRLHYRPISDRSGATLRRRLHSDDRRYSHRLANSQL